MLRRNPTRIEVKLDDFQEYNDMKKEKDEESKQNKQLFQDQTPTESMESRSRVDVMRAVHDRIGYDPKPLPQPSRLPIH